MAIAAICSMVFSPRVLPLRCGRGDGDGRRGMQQGLGSAQGKDQDGGQSRPAVKRCQKGKSQKSCPWSHETAPNVADWWPHCNRGPQDFFLVRKSRKKRPSWLNPSRSTPGLPCPMKRPTKTLSSFARTRRRGGNRLARASRGEGGEEDGGSPWRPTTQAPSRSAAKSPLLGIQLSIRLVVKHR